MIEIYAAEVVPGDLGGSGTARSSAQGAAQGDLTADDWYCRLCGEDLGDFAEVASGDCGTCERIVCEPCFGDYDEQTCEVTCAACVRRAAERAAL